MEILNAQQAFETMQSGQTVLCRAIGDLLEFDELRHFPATVFFGTDYEFCIAPRFMSIGHLDLDVPECIQGFDDLVNAVMYYAPNLLNVDRPIEILSNADNTSYLERLIVAKLLHKKSEDAIAHAKGFITLNGGSLDYVEVKAPVVEEKPKKSSASLKKEYILKMNDAETIADINYIHSCFTADDDLSGPHLAYLKDAYTQRKEKIKLSLEKADEVQAVETDPEKLIANFTAQINECESVDAVLSVRSTFACNGHLDREHVQALCKLVEEKNAELDPEAYAQNTTSNDVVEKTSDNVVAFKPKQVVDENTVYEEVLKDLIDRANQAKTPVEAHALLKYASSWSVDQKTPLIQAINNRLIVIGQQNQKPSLMVQIQNAPDLMALDALEIDIAEHDPQIQSKLMEIIELRRSELTG